VKRLLAVSFAGLLIFTACPNDDKTPSALDPPVLIAPANGSTITQNPPTMVWHNVDQSQILYQFEVAADSLFGTLVFSSGSIFPPDTFYTLDSTLASGTYYWHACVWEDC
jgi:hypothetical protein